MQKSFGYSIKPRFGLFSQPYPIASGESNAFPKTRCRKGEDGLVETEPRNFYTKRLRKGASEDVLFMKSSKICRGDPYQDKKKQGRPFDPEGYLKAGHEAPFKPAKSIHMKIPNKPPY
jgi:hypothetical protein